MSGTSGKGTRVYQDGRFLPGRIPGSSSRLPIVSGPVGVTRSCQYQVSPLVFLSDWRGQEKVLGRDWVD